MTTAAPADGREHLRVGLARSGLGWYPATAVGLLAMVDQFQNHALIVLGPEISRSLGMSRSQLAGARLLGTLALVFAALPVARLVQTGARRAVVSLATATGWGLTTMLAAFVAGASGLTTVLVADGASSASVHAVHPSLLADSYPPGLRVRLFSFYRAMDAAGNVLSPLLVAALTAVAGLSWRGVLLVLGAVSLAFTLASSGLRDPGFGRWDEAGGSSPDHDPSTSLRFTETVRRLLLVPTLRRVLVAVGLLGMCLVPLNTYLFFFLDERWNLDPSARGLFLAAMAGAAAASLPLAGPRGERRFARDPASFLQVTAAMTAGALVTLAASVLSPVFVLMVLLQAVSTALSAAAGAFLTATVVALVPARVRPHASALRGIAAVGVGGLTGLLVLSGLDTHVGTAGAIVAVSVVGMVAAAVLATAAGTVGDDLRRLDAAARDEAVAARRAPTARAPLLACRDVCFAYDRAPVLSGLRLEVGDGEVVALLGSNGAGKSTVLRVIAGLGLPGAGSVQWHGSAITYLAPQRRAALGMVHVDAGSVFPPLTVVENLRAFGYGSGRRRAAVEEGVEAAFEALPALAARRHQPASSLSGGERQALALGRVLVASPRLICADEPFSGLAPDAVERTASILRTAHRAGSAILLVDQSVPLALGLATRAYVLDGGRVRFEGSSHEVLARHDLFRTAFVHTPLAEEGANRW